VKFIESFPGRNRENLCHSQLELLNDLTKLLEKVDLPKNSKEGTTSILRGQLDDLLSETGWRVGYLVESQISMEYPTANYTLDLNLDEDSSNCEHRHRYLLEFCFDNRQAIGTNLLKFEVAALNAISQNWIPLPILICGTAAAIKQFGWDGGVASYQEYDHAIRIPYKNILSNPPVLLALF
jgi:hypothetical protein